MKIPFLKPEQGLTVLRIVVSSVFIIHSITRVSDQSVGHFGEFLSGNGIPLGTAVAYGITGFEFIGGILMALGRYANIIGLVFVVHQIMGITLVHSNYGWFVVGHSTGGMEYSVLIIAALIAVVATSKENS